MSHITAKQLSCYIAEGQKALFQSIKMGIEVDARGRIQPLGTTPTLTALVGKGSLLLCRRILKN
jgi:hypothetical protein